MKYIALTVVALTIFGSAFAEVNVCSNVTNGIFLADLTNCSQYITCYNDKAYPGVCPDSLFFDASTQRCDVASKTNCIQQCNSSLTTFAYTKTCTKYVLCYDSTPIVQQCLDGLQYNAATDRCDFAYNVDCQANLCTAVNDPSNIRFLNSHQSCSRYFICYDGVAVKQECASGLYFNMEKENCDYKANVVCDVSATKRTVLPYAKSPPTRANIPCPKQGSHFYPHASDTASYYFCLNGNGVVLTCSPGLIYDKTAETCRDPINVKN